MTGTPASGLSHNQKELSFPAEDVGIFDRASRMILSETRNPGRWRKLILLDPGSHPASVFTEASPDRPRDLTGMTNGDTAPRH